MEIWKSISGWEGQYEVSDLGRIRSVDRLITYPDGHEQIRMGKILFINKVNSGYEQVTFYRNQKAYRYYVHQLVAQTFIENPCGYTEIHHKDYDKENNTVENLQWTSHVDNIVDLHIHKYEVFKDSHNTLGINRCQDCGESIYYKSKWCKNCANKHRKKHYKHNKLSKEEVKKSIERANGNFTQAAKQFDMTDNSLRKWCKKYNLPTHSKEWKELLREQSY